MSPSKILFTLFSAEGVPSAAWTRLWGRQGAIPPPIPPRREITQEPHSCPSPVTRNGAKKEAQGAFETKEASHEVCLLTDETENQPNNSKHRSQLIIYHPFGGNLTLMERSSRSSGSSRWDWLVLPEEKHTRH